MLAGWLRKLPRILTDRLGRSRSRRWQEPPGQQASARPDLRQRNRNATARYRPSPYDGAMTLICVGPPHDQRGWTQMATGGCRFIELPPEGPLLDMPHLTQPPYVAPLAKAIRALLDETPGPKAPPAVLEAAVQRE